MRFLLLREFLDVEGIPVERRAAFSAVSQGAVGARALVRSVEFVRRQTSTLQLDVIFVTQDEVMVNMHELEATADKHEATAAVDEPAPRRRRRWRSTGWGVKAQIAAPAAADESLYSNTEPVGFAKVACMLAFLRIGLKVQFFVPKVTLGVFEEGYFFVGIGIVVPKIPEIIAHGNTKLTTFEGLEGRVVFWPEAYLSLLTRPLSAS
eukprot:tig00000310_g24007.t1